MKLFSNQSTISMLERGLQYSSTKQKVIANNIANIDTPNYKAKQVSFRAELDQAMNSSFKAKQTNSRHVPFTSGGRNPVTIFENKHTAYNHNGNNVDIDAEMAAMAENQIYYNALVDRINGKFNSLNTVIRGGR